MKERILGELRLLYSTKTQSEEGKRATWLDMAKGLAIVLVVIGHRGFIQLTTSSWISSFHLPLFFVVSGVLIFWKDRETAPLHTQIGKKAKSLLVPYVWFSFGSLLLELIQIYRGNSTWIDLRTHAVQTVSLQGYSVLWFLPACFLGECLLLVLIRLFGRGWKGKIISAVITTLLAMTMYSLWILIWRAIVYSGHLTYWSGQFLEEWKAVARGCVAAAFMSYGGLLVTFFRKRKSFCWWELLLGIVLMVPNVIVGSRQIAYDLNNLQIHWSPWYLLLGAVGSAGVLLICKNCVNIPPLTYLGRNSLIIMVTHMNFYVMYFGSILGTALNNRIPFGAEYFSLNIYSMVCTFLLEIPVIFVVNLLFPFLLGKRIPDKK